MRELMDRQSSWNRKIIIGIYKPGSFIPEQFNFIFKYGVIF